MKSRSLMLAAAALMAGAGAALAQTVKIDAGTGVVTNANGTTTALAPGTTVIVLPSPSATSAGAGGVISGVVVPADSVQVAAILAAFVGSSANLTSLDAGLRNRSSVTLTSAAGSATFVPPVGPLTPAESTQTLLLSLSQLNALGIAQPTPQQIQASLLGGNIATSSGQTVALQGILQLRSQGFSFVQIAQALGSQTVLSAPGATAQTPAVTGREPARGAAGTVPTGRSAAHPNPATGTSAATAPATATGTTGTTGTTFGTTTATNATSPFSSSGNAGTLGGNATFTANGTTQAGSGPRGSPSATGGGGLR